MNTFDLSIRALLASEFSAAAKIAITVNANPKIRPRILARWLVAKHANFRISGSRKSDRDNGTGSSDEEYVSDLSGKCWEPLWYPSNVCDPQ
jgi:hypothetical protein